MAYAIPIVEDLQSQQPKIQRNDGPVAMVIVPTREVRTEYFLCFGSQLESADNFLFYT